MIKMLNNNLLCREVKEDVVGSVSGFETTSNEKRFKKLEVVHSNEVDVITGCMISVPVNSGEPHIIEDVAYTVVRRGDVVWFE